MLVNQLAKYANDLTSLAFSLWIAAPFCACFALFLPAASAAAGLHLAFKVTLTDSLNAKEALCFKIEGQTYNNQMIGLSSKLN